jgi:aryl-alcohol dehydrogenase-like predicted oxidoreductase
MSAEFSLDKYRLLGRSGLRVSPLALGTMTFGLEWGWGADQDEARRIFDAYTEDGGNFIDTSNNYTDGTAERLIGAFAVGRRDRLVIATKYSIPVRADDPNSGGNHRKSMVRSVETSLKRLATDYIDLLYLHAWDSTTPTEEILRAMDDLVRAGKVLYLGVSNTQAWRVSRMQAIADLRGWSPLIALQVKYNLINRDAERDLIPMACEMKLGVIPWSPLAGGLLSGKYTRDEFGPTGVSISTDNSRKSFMVRRGLISERSLVIADVAKSIATEIGRSPSQVALAWTILNPRVTTSIIGVRTLKHLRDNLGALELELTESQRGRLDEVSAIDLGYPHDYLERLLASDTMCSVMNINKRWRDMDRIT